MGERWVLAETPLLARCCACCRAGPALAALLSLPAALWGINEFSRACASLIAWCHELAGLSPAPFRLSSCCQPFPGEKQLSACLCLPRAAGRAAEGHSKGSGGICCHFSHLCPLDVPLHCCCAAAPWAWLGAPPTALDTVSTVSGCHPAAYASQFGIQAGSVLAFFPFCFVLSVGGKREGRQINPLPVLMLCTSPCSQCQVLNFMLRPTTGALT